MTKDPHQFVTNLNEIWTHFQIFIFSFYHVSDKLTEFFQGFYRMNNCKDHEYKTRHSTQSEEVASVATIGVNELKKFF